MNTSLSWALLSRFFLSTRRIIKCFCTFHYFFYLWPITCTSTQTKQFLIIFLLLCLVNPKSVNCTDFTLLYSVVSVYRSRPIGLVIICSFYFYLNQTNILVALQVISSSQFSFFRNKWNLTVKEEKKEEFNFDCT